MSPALFPWAFLLALAALAATSGQALADNCQVPIDCFGVARSSIGASFGLLLLAGISMALDFVPGVGTAKGVIEAIIGRDVVTGEELEPWERALGILPFGLGHAADVGRMVGRLDDVAEAGRRLDDLPTGRGLPGDELQGPVASAHPPRRPTAASAADETVGEPPPPRRSPADPGELAGVGGRRSDEVEAGGAGGRGADGGGSGGSGDRGGGRGDADDGSGRDGDSGGRGEEPGDGDGRQTQDQAYVDERLQELSSDPAHGGRVTPGSTEEGRVGAELELRGRPEGFDRGELRRDPSGAADFIDGQGQAWDVKSPNSNFPPRRGGFELNTTVRDIEIELRLGENVIINTKNMSQDHIEQLRRAIQAKGWGERIKWYP